MDKQTLLKYCRYYKGESECPMKRPLEELTWVVEKMWVDNTLETLKRGEPTNDAEEALDRYIRDGMADFGKFDDTPITLKAYLYMLHLKDNEMPIRKDFERFYDCWRKKEIGR